LFWLHLFHNFVTILNVFDPARLTQIRAGAAFPGTGNFAWQHFCLKQKANRRQPLKTQPRTRRKVLAFLSKAHSKEYEQLAPIG
jgi:hypothetical protein